jgi:hypothetical protein
MVMPSVTRKQSSQIGLNCWIYTQDLLNTIFQDSKLNNFKGIQDLISPNEETTVLGPVVSFLSLNINKELIQFKFYDILSLEELQKISKYEIIPKN